MKTEEREILNTPIGNLVDAVKSHTVQPCDILRAYGKVALKAHAKTNCLTEVMIESAEAWIDEGSINMEGPLAGIPVSLKDTIIVGGYDTCLGYSSKVGNRAAKDGIMVRILKDAGAIPFVKTNIPITLLSFESTNDLWGRCTNPHNNKYSPGGSTGGESALLAAGGSRIGIGSDVAGSVRVPAASSGCYSLRCSTGRWPKGGILSSMSGQEGIPSVLSPMARTLDDLTYFSRAIMGMETWKYDHSVHPIPWRADVYRSFMHKPVYRVGVMRSDGVVDPSPACTRALDKTIAALRKVGHEIVEVDPPSPYEALVIASQLLLADNCATFESHRRSGEWLDRGVAMMKMMMALPRPLKWLYCAWVRHVRRDEVWAGLLDGWYHKTVAEQWSLVARREDYKARFHSWWQEEAQVDFLLAPVNAMPTLPHDAMRDAVSSCGYTFLFNLVSLSIPLASM